MTPTTMTRSPLASESLARVTAKVFQSFMALALSCLAAARLVGWCDIGRNSALSRRHRGVLGMGVIADWRGRGVGAALHGSWPPSTGAPAERNSRPR